VPCNRKETGQAAEGSPCVRTVSENDGRSAKARTGIVNEDAGAFWPSEAEDVMRLEMIIAKGMKRKMAPERLQDFTTDNTADSVTPSERTSRIVHTRLLATSLRR
jgi:hypothetical protein